MDSITIRQPDDFHAHLRQDDMMNNVISLSRDFARVLVMPNTTPPIATSDNAQAYRTSIIAAGATFEPLMTIKLLETTTPDEIQEASNNGVIAAKLYPTGVTTNAHDGVSDVRTIAAVLNAMSASGMVLCVHGETPNASALDAEHDFLDNSFAWILSEFPQLRVVFEHASTAHAIQTVSDAGPNVAATLTVHHLYLTIDHVIANGLQPHNYCKPVAKPDADRQALLAAVFSGNPKFFLGTDSAPHLRENKECARGAAGVFTAPLAMALLADLFDAHGAIERLESFTSEFGATFYGQELNKGTITLERTPQEIPHSMHGIVPFLAGETVGWTVRSTRVPGH